MLALILCLCLPAVAGSLPQENAPEVVRPLLEEAARHRDAGRVDEAIAKYREVLRLAPQLAQVHLSIGVLYHRQGKLADARDAFTAGLDRSPEDAVLLYNAAAVELQLGRTAEAMAYADRGLARNRDDASLRLIRASALRRLERPEDALREYQEVVRLDPKHASAYLSLGNLQHQLDRKKEALESFRQAIRYDKTLLSAYFNLGAVLYELGQDDEALRAYDVALAPAEKDLAAGRTVDASTAQAFMNLGAIYARKQNWTRALDAYRAAAHLRPDAAAFYNAGSAQYRLERWDEAQASFLRAVDLDPSMPLAHFHLGMLELRKGQDAAALDRLERALPGLAGADRHTARLTTAQLLAQKGEAAAAEARYREVLTDNATDATALVALGRLLRERGAVAEARTVIDRARTAAPADLGVALESAALARMAGDTAAERAIYTDILRRDPERADLWPIQVNLVGLLVREGATAEATRIMETLMRRLPARGAAGAPDASVRRLLHATYGILLARDGQRPAAVREFQAALREDPAFAPALAGLAVLNLLGGELQESSARLASLQKGETGQAMDALARANVGHALWLAGRGADAAPHLQEALKALPSYASLHVALGEIALTSGDRGAAIDRLTRGVELCGQRAAAPVTPAKPQSLQVAIGGAAAGSEVLCSRARVLLGAALVSSAAADAVRRPSEARDLLERAFTMPLDPATRAKAHYLRGTTHLAAGQHAAARDDFGRALAGPLPEDLKSAARNNLGIAHYRTGNIAEAIRQFEAAGRGSAQATLNLAIALHDRGDAARALPLYEHYLKLGGPRADEVRTWVDDLRRIYR